MNTEEFIKSHDRAHFMQSQLWGKVKDNWKQVFVTHEENGVTKGSVALLIRKMPLGRTLMYSPRGPVCDPHDGDTLAALTQKIKSAAKQHKAYAFKIDPDIESSDKIFVDKMKQLGYKLNETKNFEGIQPRYVFRLNIKDKTEEEVLAGFHSKTRYNIRLALKNEVECYVGTRDELPQFHAIMQETGSRDGFIIRSLDYFTRMYDALAPENLRLYLCRYQGNIVSGAIAIHYGNKVWYLYGASSNAYRNVMPNYLMQWEMIKWAVSLGCDVYDFRGVSGDLSEDNPLYGLYRFKKGFGGDFTEFVGEMELTFSPLYAFALDKGIKMFMKLRGMIKRS